MAVLKRCSVAAALCALSVAVLPVAAASPAAAPVANIEAVQGTIVRWSVPGTKRCGMGGRSWAALQETCYYPIDLLQAPGRTRVSRQGVGPAQFAQISVGASSYGTQNIDLGDIPQANPSPADLRRNTRDQALLAKVWAKREGPARFTLPLRALDALHLALAGQEGLRLATSDSDLSRSARSLGVAVTLVRRR